MKELDIKIIRLPSFSREREYCSEINCCLIPPLGTGLIAGYLREKGFSVDQDDLDIKIHWDNVYAVSPEDKIDTSIFFDTSRIAGYVNGNSDDYIDSVMERVEKKSRIEGYRVILLSLPGNVKNSSNLSFASSFSRFVKKRYNPIIILGGEGTWVELLRKNYNCTDIDFLVIGDGEEPLFNILNSLKSGRVLDMHRVIYNEISGPIVKPDFSGLPINKYRIKDATLNYPKEIIPALKDYKDSGALILPYRFIKGCPFECAFCSSANQKLTNIASPREVSFHLKALQEEYQPTGFFFVHDTINISKRFINELCDEIIDRKIKIRWSDCARANLDKDTLLKMRRAGCIRLIFGMETASPRLLKYINKQIDLEELENTLRWSDEAGIWNGLELICGLPQEYKKDIGATVSFLNKNKGYIDRMYLNEFDLRKNVPFYNFPERYSIERISEVDQYAEGTHFKSYVQFGFDEKDGLRWSDKERQIEDSRKMVQESCVRGYKFFVDEHFLFYLYSRFDDKDKVKSIYYKILQQ